MLPLRVPDNVKLIGKERVLKMPPQDREKYYEKVILDILLANREGATAKEIASNTGFAERTIRGHLDKLTARGETYAVSRGGAAFYFARGLSQEKALTIKSKNKEGLYYVITNLKNADGDFFYVQQKELDEYRALRVKGAIMIAKADGQDFIKQFHTHMVKELERE
jgi:predicted ArsR family transcriptional regulator